LDIAVLGEKKESQVTNDEKGIASLIKKMRGLRPDLIVVEATGGYQRAAFLLYTTHCRPRQWEHSIYGSCVSVGMPQNGVGVSVMPKFDSNQYKLRGSPR